jgi:hypothetical protein
MLVWLMLINLNANIKGSEWVRDVKGLNDFWNLHVILKLFQNDKFFIKRKRASPLAHSKVIPNRTTKLWAKFQAWGELHSSRNRKRLAPGLTIPKTSQHCHVNWLLGMPQIAELTYSQVGLSNTQASLWMFINQDRMKLCKLKRQHRSISQNFS